jgi:hypothetical protein
MELRLLNIQTDWPWVAKVIQPVLCADTCGIVAVGGSNEVKGAVIADSFTPETCLVHIGADTPMVLRSRLLYVAADFLFGYCKRLRIFGLTPENNEKALSFNERIGWQQVSYIPDAYKTGVGYVVFRMDAESCPWWEFNTDRKVA